MFDHLLLAVTIIVGLTVLRLVRRFEAGQSGYLVVVSAILVVLLLAQMGGDRFWGVVGIGLSALTVGGPWCLEAAARWAFGRGRLRMAVWMAGTRALLMPGAGLGRQQEILRGLAVLERDGVDSALDHFRDLAGATEDGGELALIHEQIVSMLFYGQRWDEGIAYYEGRFHPRYAALRPALALGLLRAYGESGKLDTAAGLLRALEEGPIGSDPRALGVISQARLTFLAYAGAVPVVDQALTADRRRALGLSEASGTLFRGIARARAGQSDGAADLLRRVPTLAGPAEDRVVDASRSTIERLEERTDELQVDLAPDLRKYADIVAQRLDNFLRLAVAAPRLRTLLATPGLIAAIVAGYAAVMVIDRGGIGLLVAGAATPQGLLHAPLVAVTGLFVHADPVTLLVGPYALWLAGPLLERLMGAGRLWAVAALSGLCGIWVTGMTSADPIAVLSGVTPMAIGVAMAGLSTVLLRKLPLPRAKRAFLIPLSLVLVALVVASLPSLPPSVVPGAGLAAAAAVGVILVLLPTRGVVARGVGILGWLFVAAVPVSIAQRATEDVEATALAAPRKTVEADGVRIRLPTSFEPTPLRRSSTLPMDALPGYRDALSLRGGHLVQVLTATSIAPGHDAAITGVAAGVGREFGIVEAEVPALLTDALGSLEIRSHHLRRNGEVVAQTVQRRIETPGGPAWVIVSAAPPSALLDAPRLWAAIVRDADAAPAAPD